LDMLKTWLDVVFGRRL